MGVSHATLGDDLVVRVRFNVNERDLSVFVYVRPQPVCVVGARLQLREVVLGDQPYGYGSRSRTHREVAGSGRLIHNVTNLTLVIVGPIPAGVNEPRVTGGDYVTRGLRSEATPAQRLRGAWPAHRASGLLRVIGTGSATGRPRKAAPDSPRLRWG